MNTITTKNTIDFLLQPIIPIGVFGYFICSRVCGDEIFLMGILFLLFGFVFYKIITLVRMKYITLYNIGIGCVDWFLLDIVNLFSNNTYSSLNPSILETLSKLSLQVVLQ